MSLGKFKNEVEDPGQAHLPKGDGISAPCQDFSGQPHRDTEGDGFTTEVPLHTSDTSNPKNGSGGSCRTISPGSVKGSNP